MNKQLEVELVIFDMDGLMFDTERIAYTSWREAAKKYDYEVDMDLFKKTVGSNLTKTREIYINYFGQDFPFNIIKDERFRITDEIIKANGVPVKKGLYELINYLNDKGIKKAVATSTSRRRALNILSLARLDSMFDCILCGDEIVNSKPDPEIFLKVAERLQCITKKCLVLEDSEAGIMAAFKAGMNPIMIPDMKEPSEETEKIIYKKMGNLSEVKLLLEESFNKSSIA